MMRSGCCECDITPALGMERPGNYTKKYHTSLHDGLKARAAVFDNGATRAAMVSVDACVLDARLVAQARDRIQSRCGIPAENIMIAATHTHSGGPLFGVLAADFEDAPRRVRELAVRESVVIDPVYLEWTISQIVTAVTIADQRKRAVRLSFDTGRASGVAFNRRFKMKNGRVYTHPGRGNPEIVGPAGPVDDEVAVLGVWNENGLAGCIVNFACHATTMTEGISADWIFYLEQTIRGVLGKDAVVLFISGAAGDVTQVDNLSMRDEEFGEYWARVVGTTVGAEAVRLLSFAKPAEFSEVKVVSSRTKVPRRPPSPARLAKARKVIESTSTPPESNEWVASDATTEFLMSKELVILDHIIAHQRSVDVEVQALQVGPSLWLANGSEFFAEAGLEVKRRSPFPKTQVVTLANAALGYTPPEAAFRADGGGYETVLTSYSNLAVSAAETIVSESVKLSKSFTPPSAQPPATASTRVPWSYGTLGPELD